MSKAILCTFLCVVASITLTVPPTSDDTQTYLPSGVQAATRGRLSTSTLATTLSVAVSMKCAMLVVSQVSTTILPSGLVAMPSGSMPTGISPMILPRGHVEERHLVVVLVDE